jgi:dipeptidyl aminopeptidase/acylaminoacyl peptidase
VSKKESKRAVQLATIVEGTRRLSNPAFLRCYSRRLDGASLMNKSKWKSISLGGARRLTAGGVHHRAPAWSSDGQWLAFVAGDGLEAAWVIADRKGRVARVIAGPADGGASFAPDGALAFGRGGSEIWLAPPGGAPLVRLLGGDGKGYREPAFSPDGTQLAFTLADGARAHLGLLEISSGKRRPLTADPARIDGHPAFSPDGEELFFDGASGDGAVGVFAMALATSEIERVTANGALSRRPAPLTRELFVVERHEEGSVRPVLVDRRRARERELLDDEAAEFCVHRSKKGRVRLAFVATRSNHREIYVARMHGVNAVDQERLPTVVEVPPNPDPERPVEEAAP